MTEQDWNAPGGDCLGVFLDGRDAGGAPLKRAAVGDDSFLLLFNPRGEPVTFWLPDARFARWEVVLDTAAGQPRRRARHRGGQRGGHAQPGRQGRCGQPVGAGAARRGQLDLFAADISAVT